MNKYVFPFISILLICCVSAWSFNGISVGLSRRDNATNTIVSVTPNDNVDLGIGELSSGSIVINNTTPSIKFKDLDATAGDENAAIEITATDVGDGTEDIDVIFKQQVNGVETTYMSVDADGTLDLGSATKNIQVVGDLTVTGGDVTLGTSSVAGGLAVHDAGTITMYDDGDNTNVIVGPVADGTTTLGVTGSIDISNALTVHGDTNLGADDDIANLYIHDAGAITFYDDSDDTNVVVGPVADGTNTLGITGSLSASGSVKAGNLTIGSGSITDTSGTISFSDENLTTSGVLTLRESSLRLLDNDLSHGMTIKQGSNLTAERIFTLVTGDANRQLTLSTDIALDQNLITTSDAIFNSVTTGYGGLITKDLDASHTLSIRAGSDLTAGRILTFVTGDTNRQLTLSTDLTLDQAVSTTSDVAFNTLTLSNGGLKLKDIGGSYTLNPKSWETLTANRELRFITGDATRTLTIGADVTLNQNTGTSDNVVFNSVTLPGYGLRVKDLVGSYYLQIQPYENFTANRELRILTGNATRTLTLSGDASLDQDVRTSANVAFNRVTIPAAGLRIKDLSGSYYVSTQVFESLTANRALKFVTNNADRTITLNGNPTLNDWFDQAVKTTSSPSFAGAQLGAITQFTGSSYQVGKTIQTTDATVTQIDSTTLGISSMGHIEATILAVKSDQTDRASYKIAATVYRQGGAAAALQGAPVIISTVESDATWDVSITVSGNDAIINVTGKAGTTIKWGCTTKYVKLSI